MSFATATNFTLLTSGRLVILELEVPLEYALIGRGFFAEEPLTSLS